MAHPETGHTRMGMVLRGVRRAVAAAPFTTVLRLAVLGPGAATGALPEDISRRAWFAGWPYGLPCSSTGN